MFVIEIALVSGVNRVGRKEHWRKGVKVNSFVLANWTVRVVIWFDKEGSEPIVLDDNEGSPGSVAKFGNLSCGCIRFDLNMSFDDVPDFKGRWLF